MLTHLRQEITDLLSAAHPKSEKRTLRRNVDLVVDEAQRLGMDDGEIGRQLQSWSTQFPRRRHYWISADAALADLRGLLLGPRSTGARTWDRLRSIAGWVFDHYVAVASLVAVIASVFYGLAYSRFYDALDMTPEQAGLTPTQILAHSTVGGLALVALIAIPAFCIFLPAVPVRDDLAAKDEPGSWRKLALNAVLAVCGIVVMFALAAITGAPPVMPAVFSSLVLVFLLSVSFRRRQAGRRFDVEPRPLRFSFERYLIVFVAVAVPVGLLFTALATFSEAERLGQRASNGEAIRDPKIVGLPFLGVRAEPALISWRSGEPTMAGIPRCAFYLGGSSGYDIFYDHRTHSTFHVPTGEITMELRGSMTNCDAPVNTRIPSLRERKDSALVCDPGRWESHSRLGAHFTYTWITEGVPISNGDSRRPWEIDADSRSGWPVRCRVTASNAFGSEVAFSPAR